MLVFSFYVIIEPAPSDAIFILVLVVSIVAGMTFRLTTMPLAIFLLLFNIGGLMSFIQIIGNSKAAQFVETSSYMAVTAIFFSSYIAKDTLRRAALIRNALILAGVFASIFAIAGYLHIGGFVGGSPDFQSRIAGVSRAVGLFKDPNVFATYIIFPALMLMQGFMLGEQHHKFISAAGLLIILAALFLAFSRGAWISFVASALLLILFTYLLVPPNLVQMRPNRMRSRIAFFVVVGLAISVAMLAILLSFAQVRDLFLDRFTLVKDYDSGETGRFANQLNSIPMLLVRPLGFGPLQFSEIFRSDSHNVYVNSFSAYGWLGGISYCVLIILTLVVGFKTILIRAPWQNFALVVYCPLVTTIFQGIQIDTDHWRHFYWLLGLTWGLFSASLAYANASHNSGSRFKTKQPVE